MENALTLPPAAIEYAEVYKSIHGEYPIIRANGDEFELTTKLGTCIGYTAAELANLARNARRLVARGEAA